MLSERLEDGELALFDRDADGFLEVLDVGDEHGVLAVGRRLREQLLRPPDACVERRVARLGEAGQRRFELRSPEGQVGRLARAAVLAREHLADRDLERPEGAPDRPRLVPALLAEVPLRRAVFELDDEVVLLRVVCGRVAEVDDEPALLQCLHELDYVGSLALGRRLRSATAAGQRERDEKEG